STARIAQAPRNGGRREALVESILAAVPVLDFDLLAARAHARLWADLVNAGSDVGAHDGSLPRPRSASAGGSAQPTCGISPAFQLQPGVTAAQSSLKLMLS